MGRGLRRLALSEGALGSTRGARFRDSADAMQAGEKVCKGIGDQAHSMQSLGSGEHGNHAVAQEDDKKSEGVIVSTEGPAATANLPIPQSAYQRPNRDHRKCGENQGDYDRRHVSPRVPSRTQPRTVMAKSVTDGRVAAPPVGQVTAAGRRRAR